MFLNRWSYGGCDTSLLTCLSDDLVVEWGRLSAHADTCSVGFHLVG